MARDTHLTGSVNILQEEIYFRAFTALRQLAEFIIGPTGPEQSPLAADRPAPQGRTPYASNRKAVN